MTDQEIKPYLGKAVRVTLADRRVLAGVLHASDESGHGHLHYVVVSDAIREGGRPVRELIHGGDQIATIEDAAGDPAATP
jgi:small nuclear ribonucleoprotein (snRNP)-like protein